MKFIIFGLGNFGSELGGMLTNAGHEVLGIDNNMSRVEMWRNRFTNTICLDSTDQTALKTLPLKEADMVVVAIGEDFGASVFTTANLKQIKVNRLVSRSISKLHENVLVAIGVDEILSPEAEAAAMFLGRIEYGNIVHFSGAQGPFRIAEITLPSIYEGIPVKEAGFTTRHNLMLITIKRRIVSRNLLGVKVNAYNVLGFVQPDEILQKGDVLEVFGRIDDIRSLSQQA
jgi:trk system potassium uptake protein TrkA